MIKQQPEKQKEFDTRVIHKFKKRLWMLRWICCVLPVVLFSCGTSAQGEPSLNEKNITIGKGSFVYQEYEPLKNKPLNVWFYNPAGHPGETAMPHSIPLLNVMVWSGARSNQELQNIHLIIEEKRS